MAQELVIAFFLGIIGGFIPGPVLAAIFTEILQSAFKKSLRIIFIAFFVETFVALISLFLFSYLNPPEQIFRLLSIIGAAILISIAFSMFKIKSLDKGGAIYFSTWKIITMILANGGLWTYWITICIPKAILLKSSVFYGDLLFVLLVQLGWLIATIFVAVLFKNFRPIIAKPNIIPVLFKLFAFTFLYFAVKMIYDSLQFFSTLIAN